MLDILAENRSGVRIELIIPTFNEERNIKRIINAYKSVSDIVIIDDNSSDKTIEIALANNCTVYRRNRFLEPVSFAPTEVPITHYVNNLTLSGKCAKLDADEMIPLDDFNMFFSLLDQVDVVLGRRVDVIGGIQLNYTAAIFPVAFKKGTIYCVNRLHSAIQPVDGYKIHNNICTNYHLDLVIESERFGKTGKYCFWEIQRVSRRTKFSSKFFRRFFVPILTFSIRNIAKHPPKFYFHYILKYVTEFFLSIIIVQNENLFGDKEHQITKSDQFFSKHL